MSAELLSELKLVLPLLIVSVGSLLLLTIESVFRQAWPRGLFTAVIIVAAAYFCRPGVELGEPQLTILGGALYADPFCFFVQLLLLLSALLALMLGFNRMQEQGIESPCEYYCLLLMATAGALIFVSAAELVTLFVGLEIMSMALYALCGSALKLKRSSESALKYFLLGSFSSAFLLYGIALIYGLSGTTSIAALENTIGSIESPLLYIAAGLIIIGLVFKIGAVPFHFWAPDVYQGAPTSITAYMACVIKAAAFAATLRVLWVAFDQVTAIWSGAIWTMAVLTMTLGNIVALRQRSLKRMLAYSSIAHAGYMMVALLAPASQFGGGAAILYYLIAYTLMTMGAFAVLMVVCAPYWEHSEPDDISRFEGLGYTRPWLAAAMALFMLSMAGIPPGVAGLVGKFYIFGAAVKADYVGLVIIAVLNSAISCYYYLRVIVAMYFNAVKSQAAPIVGESEVGAPMLGALAICSVGVLAIGLFPSALYESAAVIVQSLF